MVAQKTFDFRLLAECLMTLAVFLFVALQIVGYDRFVAWGGGNAVRPLGAAMIVWVAIHISIRRVLRNRKRAGTAGFPPQGS